MSDLPLVSIVVVSYNQGKYIRENLNSIKAQTYPNIELIVADDASPDNSVEIFNEWLTKHNYPAKRNFHNKNTGLATVLNECVEMVTGKYVKLIAADDFLHPESIEKCVRKLEEVGEEYGMVFTDTFTIDKDGNKIRDIMDYSNVYVNGPKFFRHELLGQNRIAALTVVMRTNVLIETGKYKTEYLIEDYHRWLLINDKYFIAFISEKLSFYRMHGNNTSALQIKRIIEEDVELRLIFDNLGVNREFFHHYFLDKYSLKEAFPHHLFELYKMYPARSNLLITIIKYSIHPRIYNLLRRIIK